MEFHKLDNPCLRKITFYSSILFQCNEWCKYLYKSYLKLSRNTHVKLYKATFAIMYYTIKEMFKIYNYAMLYLYTNKSLFFHILKNTFFNVTYRYKNRHMRAHTHKHIYIIYITYLIK